MDIINTQVKKRFFQAVETIVKNSGISQGDLSAKIMGRKNALAQVKSAKNMYIRIHWIVKLHELYPQVSVTWIILGEKDNPGHSTQPPLLAFAAVEILNDLAANWDKAKAQAELEKRKQVLQT